MRKTLQGEPGLREHPSHLFNRASGTEQRSAIFGSKPSPTEFEYPCWPVFGVDHFSNGKAKSRVKVPERAVEMLVLLSQQFSSQNGMVDATNFGNIAVVKNGTEPVQMRGSE